MTESPMRPVLLDGRFMTTKERAHEILRSALDFPEYYGNNLDALHDCLTELCYVSLTVYFTGDLRKNLREYGDQLLTVMRDAARENPVFSVQFL